jgi:hypothetical protein
VCTLSSRQGRVWGGFGNSNLAAIVNFLKFFLLNSARTG